MIPACGVRCSDLQPSGFSVPGPIVRQKMVEGCGEAERVTGRQDHDAVPFKDIYE